MLIVLYAAKGSLIPIICGFLSGWRQSSICRRHAFGQEECDQPELSWLRSNQFEQLFYEIQPQIALVFEPDQFKGHNTEDNQHPFKSAKSEEDINPYPNA